VTFWRRIPPHRGFPRGPHRHPDRPECYLTLKRVKRIAFGCHARVKNAQSESVMQAQMSEK
jgi:hypothetical protein